MTQPGYRSSGACPVPSSLVQVLICDDEPAIRLLYRSAFEVEGAEVSTACDGDEAIEMARQGRPDLIVLDIRMPHRDGLSTLAELRACCPESQVMLVSAEASFDHFTTGRELGAVACFDKMDFLGRIPRLVSERLAG